MKNNNLLKYFFCFGSIIYTVGTTFIVLISLSLAQDKANTAIYARPLLSFLLFSFMMSLGSTLFRYEKISSPVRRLSHALCYILGLLVFLLLGSLKFYAAVIVTAVFAIIYGIAVLIKALISGNLGRLSSPNAPAGKSTNKSQASTKKINSKQNQPTKEQYKNRFS